MLKNKKAVIFDLDGTLVDSMGLWMGIDIEYLGRHGLTVPEDLQPAIEGFSFTEVAVYFKNRFGLTDSIEQIKDDWNRMAMEKYRHEVPLKPGAARFIAEMRRRGILLGVASSNSVELVSAALEAHNILSDFSCILTCCEVQKGKPEPDVYLETAGRMGVCPEDCLVFEDIPAGILAGKAAHMATCAVYDDYSVKYEDQKRSLADFYIRSYDEVLDGTYEVL